MALVADASGIEVAVDRGRRSGDGDGMWFLILMTSVTAVAGCWGTLRLVLTDGRRAIPDDPTRGLSESDGPAASSRRC